MQIDYDILIAYGGVAKKIQKGEILFWEGNMPHFYYQLVEGCVKLFSTDTDGKELVLGVFNVGQSFGEPPLLLDKPYPIAAQATTAGVIVKIDKTKLLQILKDYPDIYVKLLYTFAERIYNNTSTARISVCLAPEEKIIRFLKWKKDTGYILKGEPVPFTRQQIANFIGIRVETVIRTLNRMCKEGKVKIINHKLYCI